ncbi:response regulator transcription factor [Bradyrhizobium sp. WYCCWR 13022]|uniref:helix-turn-helix transcriptional regulator n=1 Tax=unclassified Bradyrhizobium TaxID=2631580 RepID=UPI00263B4921|nr:response regulator transcription factor [Bradyrhizobium sp. WYCCWR 13022]MDN4981823.1 response regulator transcription factor [Bradyrhizobium sp. WYCCWR 13022]
MDQVVSDDSCESGQLEQTISAARGGIIFVDVDGQVVGMDSTARRSLDGEVKQLDLPLRNEDARAVDCFVSAETVTIKGMPTPVCVVQEREPAEREAAIAAVLADTTSFARSIIDRIKTLTFASSHATAQDLDVLTSREKEILGLICKGKSDLEMSDRLNLSQNTVRNHISSLYRKIGVHRRSAAILWARERGITAESLRGTRQPFADKRAP